MAGGTTSQVRHRVTIQRLLRFAGIASAIVIVGAALLLRRGDAPAQRFLILYVAPLFLYGAEWVRERMVRFAARGGAETMVDAAAFLAGALRIAGGWGVLPYSGHMLFLTYAAVAPGSRTLRLLALPLLAMTTLFKLVLWNDPRSWSLGVIAGLLLAGVRAIVVRRAGVLRRHGEAV